MYLMLSIYIYKFFILKLNIVKDREDLWPVLIIQLSALFFMD